MNSTIDKETKQIDANEESRLVFEDLDENHALVKVMIGNHVTATRKIYLFDKEQIKNLDELKKRDRELLAL